jgi:hypothetical protein
MTIRLIHGGRALTKWRREEGKFWAVDVPKAKEGTWDFRVLVVNGRIAERAHLPEEGCFEHLSEFDVTYMSGSGGGWQREPTDAELTSMKYRPEDLGPWLDVNNAEVVVHHMWNESLVGVAANDVATHTLHFETKTTNPPGAFRVNKYVIYNVREGLKHPGQWYLDRTARKVVYWPLADEDMTKVRVFAPVVQTLFTAHFSKAERKNGPCFRYLKLSVTDIPAASASFGGVRHPAAIELVEAHGATFEDLEVTAVGGWFLKDRGSHNVAVRNCHIHHLGTSGVRLSQATGVIENNRIHHVGLLCNNGVGMYVSGGTNYRIRRNIVHDTPYSGMIVGGRGVNYCVEENLVYRAMRVLHDGAAFYCGTSLGLKLRRNVVRDIAAVGKGYGASAYYLDERSEDCVVEGNVAINVRRPTHNHMTLNCTLRNNVFIHEGDMALSFARSRGYTVEGNIFYTGGKLQVGDPGALAKWSGNLVLEQQPATTLETAVMSIGDQFKACVHGRSLCLAVVVVTMNPEATRKGTEWGADDAVEVALGGKDRAGKPVTWVLRGFADGQIQSATVGGAMAESAQALLKQVVYKSEIRKKDWRSEWIIPIDALGVDSAAGRPLPFNITAWRSENAEFRQYAGSLGETWDLQYGGRLLLPANK